MRSCTAVLVISVLVVWAAAAEPAGSGRKTRSPSGQQLYANHCAVCHGFDAKGGGAMAPQMKVWPPDLTLLAANNHGTYPALHVNEAIDGEFGKASHGSREMPVWGPVFRKAATGYGDSAQLRIDNLVKYIESLQER